MEKKHILILGAGISGLSAAWTLSQIAPDSCVTVLEASKRAGGWIHSSSFDEFFFEMGPRVFKASKSKALLELIDELGLQKQIAIASGASDRHILWNGKLQKLPQSPCSFFLSSFTRPLIFPLLTEWMKKPLTIADESIEEFIVRRLGKSVLDRLFDPLTQGIYAADPKELSIRSCFASLKNWEDIYGSITAGFWNEVLKKKKSQDTQIKDSTLFTLKGGVETLIKTLIEKSNTKIEYGQTALSLHTAKGKMSVMTEDRRWEADAVFIALPPKEAAKILQTAEDSCSKDLLCIPSVSVTSVLLGFSKSVLSYKGFGYLVPTKENLSILGAVFDSEAFVEQSKHKEQTRITLMLKGSGYSPKEIEGNVTVLLQKHLGIREKPEFAQVQVSECAIPKFLVGHKDRIAFLDRKLSKTLPNCYLLGNYLNGVSVSDCIKRSREQVLKWALA